MNQSMWMVRSAVGGRLADEYRDKGVVAIGWRDVGDLTVYPDKAALLEAVRKTWPDDKPGAHMNAASQLHRFKVELAKGDRVITYDSSQRIYHVGTILGDYRYVPNAPDPMNNVRDVEWDGEVQRDSLSVPTKNSLGSTLTLFRLPDFAAAEIEAVLHGHMTAQPPESEVEEQADEESLLDQYRSEAFEIIKDRLNRLTWDEMQELVAGLLRAMGYKTRVSRPGPDRGLDILASPDGFGFESPRIVVEVKHRTQAMGSQEIRSFLGGRHKDDKGLYVSTGGFTKDARYEADRANIPLMLMDIDDLVNGIFDFYGNMDMDTQKLLPLKKIHWPA